jgi:hypothetical protein
VSVIQAFTLPNSNTKIEQLSATRDWMDETFDRHAYNCFPVTLGNTVGWGLSVPEDISFVWDGVFAPQSEHVQVLSGHRYVDTNRGQATVSFNLGVMFKTDSNVSMLTLPPPNVFIDGAQCFTTVMTTSLYGFPFPLAWMITRPNKVITIPAGTPLCALVPISLTGLSEFVLEVQPENFGGEYWSRVQEYGVVSNEMTRRGEWTRFYRNAVDHEGNSLGSHEVKTLRLETVHKNNVNG